MGLVGCAIHDSKMKLAVLLLASTLAQMTGAFVPPAAPITRFNATRRAPTVTSFSGGGSKTPKKVAKKPAKKVVAKKPAKKPAKKVVKKPVAKKVVKKVAKKVAPKKVAPKKTGVGPTTTNNIFGGFVEAFSLLSSLPNSKARQAGRDA